MTQADEFKVLIEKHQLPIRRDDLEHAIASIQQSPAVDQFFLGHSHKYWRSFLFVDPIQLYREVRGPIVVAIGENDESTPVESVRVLQRYLDTRADVSHSVVVYPGADHSLRAGDVPYGLRFLEDLASWMTDASHRFSY